MNQKERAEKYFELFLDALHIEKRLMNDLIQAIKHRDEETMLTWLYGRNYYRKEVQKIVSEIRRKRAARKKIHKTLVSILGVLNNSVK